MYTECDTEYHKRIQHNISQHKYTKNTNCIPPSNIFQTTVFILTCWMFNTNHMFMFDSYVTIDIFFVFDWGHSSVLFLDGCIRAGA